MTNESNARDEVARVLGEHVMHASMSICTGCDWWSTPGAGVLADQHRNHLADALLPTIEAEVERREREAGARAWDEGYEIGQRAYAGDLPDDWDSRTANPYRATESPEGAGTRSEGRSGVSDPVEGAREGDEG